MVERNGLVARLGADVVVGVHPEGLRMVAHPDAVSVPVAGLHGVAEHQRRLRAQDRVVGRPPIGTVRLAAIAEREPEPRGARHLHRLAEGDREANRLAHAVGVCRGRSRRGQRRRRGHRRHKGNGRQGGQGTPDHDSQRTPVDFILPTNPPDPPKPSVCMIRDAPPG